MKREHVKPDLGGILASQIRLIDAVAAPVLLLEGETIRHANPGAAQLLALPADTLAGRSLREYISYDSGGIATMEPVTASLRQAQGEPVTVSLTFRALDPDRDVGSGVGQPGPVLLTIHLPPVPGRVEQFESIHNELKDQLQELPLDPGALEHGPQSKRQALKELVAVWRDLKEHERLMAENLRQEELLQRIFEIDPSGMAVLSGEDLIFRVVNPAFRESTPNPEINPIGRPFKEIWPEYEDEIGERMLRQVLQTGEANHIDSFELTFPDGARHFYSLRMHPLTWRDEPGVLVVIWETTELERAHAAEKESAGEALRRANELEALVSVAGALRNAIVQDEMVPKIMEQIMALMNAEGASMVMQDASTGEVFVHTAVGQWEHVTGQRMLPGTGIIARVLDSAEPYLSNNIQDDPDLARSIFAGGLTSGACVPLRSHGQVIGAIWIGRLRPISQDDVRLLSAIADIAASNMFRALLFEQTQLRLQRISALHNIDMAITSSLDLQLTLSVLLDQVVSQMNVDAADILLFDPGLHWLEFASGRGFLRPTARMEPYRLGDSPAGQVALERRAISIPDIANSEVPIEGWIAPEEGFRSYFASPLIAKGQVKGVIELFNRELFRPDREWMEFLDTLATQAAIAIDGAELFERLQRSNEELTVAYDATIEGWSRALELRDHETHGHARRVTEQTIRLARRMGVPEEEISHYRRGVLLHDIGKMAVPDSILLKDGPLTPEEKETMRRHPAYAYELLHPIAYLRPALDIPYCHHEWWDGSGYPRQLKGDEIPLSARIFAVVDVWDALCSDRSYRPAWPVHKVLEHIRSMAGTHFDPQVVDEFIKMVHTPSKVTQQRY